MDIFGTDERRNHIVPDPRRFLDAGHSVPSISQHSPVSSTLASNQVHSPPSQLVLGSMPSDEEQSMRWERSLKRNHCSPNGNDIDRVWKS